MKILLTIQYDGKNFSGWQIQNNNRTVQEEIQNSLSKLFKTQILIRGASRTDAGVSAMQQIATFDHDFNIPLEKLPFAINSFLPKDISIVDAKVVPQNFHPQYNVFKKTYRYKIYNEKFANPIFADNTEFVSRPLDLDKMNQACRYLIGKNDFKAFCSAKTNAKTTTRTIFDLNVFKNDENIVTIQISGDGFLYNMVRIVAGTLINVGTLKYPPEYVKNILLSKNRALAGKTASAKGLLLYKIYYNI